MQFGADAIPYARARRHDRALIKAFVMDFLVIETWSFLWDAERFDALAEELGPLAPLMSIMAMVIVSFLPLPAETVAVANGMAFGRWTGFSLTWFGAMIAACLAFYIAKTLGRPLIARILPARMIARFESMIENRGAPFLLFVRMIPFVPYTIVNYGAGLSPVRFSTFFWTSALGMTPPIFAFVSAGAMMRDDPWLGWFALGAIFALFGLLAFAWRKRESQSSEASEKNRASANLLARIRQGDRSLPECVTPTIIRPHIGV